MSLHSLSSQRNRKQSYPGLPAMDHPDLRGLRTSSMPLSNHPDPDSQHQQDPPYPLQRRSSSPLLTSQHVPPQNFTTATHPQFHPHQDQKIHPDHVPPSQHTPPLSFPRPVQRVPPPPLLPPDSRFNTIRAEWTMTDQLLAEIDRAAHDQSAAGLGPGAGAQQLPTMEGGRERAREQRDDSGGSTTGRLRNPPSRDMSPPPRTPPLALSQTQAQRPLPVVPDRPPLPRQNSSSRSNDGSRSPTYYSPLATPPSDHAHGRDQSPLFRFDERACGAVPTKVKTPDRSLPVQEEENEVEEDVTITPASERRERDMEREKAMAGDLRLPPPTRGIDHRLPTPQFSSSPMISPERMRTNEAPSDVELSTTVQGQGDEYSDHDHNHDRGAYDQDDGRSSRAAHRFEDEQHRAEAEDQDQDQDQEQDEAESYTPRSHHANLNGSGDAPNTNANTNANANAERVVYGSTAAAAHLHFRPRTASSDAGGMDNLDAAVLRDAIDKLRGPGPGPGHYGGAAASHAHGQHTALPARVPTAEEIRALVADNRIYDAWQQHIRPGAPVPPTPPNATFSPGPPRSTPYPYSYPYQHVFHRSQDPQQLLHHMQQQQLQQLQLLAANGMQTDSTFSPSATPYPHAHPAYEYSPFLPEHFRRADDPSMSLRSSPSHLPVSMPVFTRRKSVRRVRGIRELAPPLRGASTEPRETSPEPEPEPEDEEGEYEEFDALAAQLDAGAGAGAASENAASQDTAREDDAGEWVDEDEDDEDDLLHLEYHPNFVVNPDKRRKRWELKWDALVKAFQALDRQTDSTLFLLAAPTHGKATFAVRSRSLRRIPALASAPELARIKASFRALSAQRQAARAQARHMSLAERFEHYASSSEEGGGEREEELKGALGAALSSLSALSSIYEGREQRWRMEMGRMGDERERVEVLLRQALGMGFGPGVV